MAHIKLTDLLSEGFSVKINNKGTVPIGEFTYKYTAKGEGKFIANSVLKRKGMKIVKQTKDMVIVKGNAREHMSLIKSFSGLRLDGEVTNVN